MRKLLSCSMVMAFLCLAGPQDATAQGWGGFWNYMNKLSGPPTTGGGVSYFSRYLLLPSGDAPDLGLEDRAFKRAIALPGVFGVRLRISHIYNWAFDTNDTVDPDGSSIRMFSITPRLEFRFIQKGNFHTDLGVGASFNNFHGDAHGFWHTSYPLLFLPGYSLGTNWDIKAGIGVQIFPAFGVNDFHPLTVDVLRTGTEYPLNLSLGIDYYWNW